MNGNSYSTVIHKTQHFVLATQIRHTILTHFNIVLHSS